MPSFCELSLAKRTLPMFHISPMAEVSLKFLAANLTGLVIVTVIGRALA